MNTKIITTTEEFLKLKPDWERLEKQSPDVTYYSTFEYISTWWSVYEKQKKLQLFIIVIEHDNKIVGIGPFLLEKINKRFIKYTELKFIGRGDYLDVLIDFSLPKPQTVIKIMFKMIEKEDALWDKINFTHVKSNSLFAHYIFKSKYNVYFKYLVETPTIKLQETLNLKQIKKEMPKKINNILNKFDNNSDIFFSINKGNVIKQMAKVHINEKNVLINKGRIERYSLFEDELRNDFLNKLYDKSNNIRTYCIYDRQELLLGYRSGYIFNDTFYSWNTAYEPRYGGYRFGNILIYKMMEDSIKNKDFSTISLGSGRYPWKFEWTNQFNLVYQLQYINPENKKLEKYNKLMRIKRAIKS